MEDKTCPKCGSRMLSDKKLGSGATEATLIYENEFKGDDIKTYYCRKCGYIELYRIENKRRPSPATEKELDEYSDTQE
jgi:predicted nucleic-acid-binding Zn-ribbon protein